MTREAHDQEWRYILDERRGMIAGANKLTAREEAQAQREAAAHMDAIEAQEQKQQQRTTYEPHHSAGGRIR